jgi:hypothetical protein
MLLENLECLVKFVSKMIMDLPASNTIEIAF